MRIFEACGANIADLGEEHGHRMLKVRGKGSKVILTPFPPAVQRAIDRARRNLTGRAASGRAATRISPAQVRRRRLRPRWDVTLVGGTVDAEPVHLLKR